MNWLYLISVFIPDSVKSERWILWDRKATWKNCREVYGDFGRAYQVLRVHEDVIELIKEIERERTA